MAKQCVICGKQLKCLNDKYDLKDKTKLCTDCASKFGVTKFYFKELNAAHEMTPSQIKEFITNGISMDPKRYLNNIKQNRTVDS